MINILYQFLKMHISIKIMVEIFILVFKKKLHETKYNNLTFYVHITDKTILILTLQTILTRAGVNFYFFISICHKCYTRFVMCVLI